MSGPCYFCTAPGEYCSICDAFLCPRHQTDYARRALAGLKKFARVGRTQVRRLLN
jgi:hypothetical protein